MRPCLVGIGGAGGELVKQFLKSQDVCFKLLSFGDHLAFGGVTGIWLDSDLDDAKDQSFFGSLMEGTYPGYIISHDIIKPNSNTRTYIMSNYGHDLKIQGYDRRAEYLKAVFEIFEKDPLVQAMARDEFNGETNPIPAYIWRKGFRRFTSITAGLNNTISSSQDTKGSNRNINAKEKIDDASTSKSQVFEIIDSGNSLNKAFSVVENLSSKNKENCGTFSEKPCDAILFIASLGGGTGTGFVNPLSKYVRMEERAFPIFALGVLTEKGKDSRHQEEGKRNLAAVIAMYDLLTKKPGEGIDSLILVDNQVLFERFGGNYESMDKTFFQSMRPVLDPRNYPDAKNQDDAPAFRNHVWTGLRLPPILVPCYHVQRCINGGEAELVRNALEKGKLFSCDPRTADMAFVFTRGLVDEAEIIKSIKEATGLKDNKVMVYRKIGDIRSQEILIMLRNPYGGKDRDSMNGRLKEIIVSALDFLKQNAKVDHGKVSIINQADYQPKTKEHLETYFYGPGGLCDHLKDSLSRLNDGNYPIFTADLEIFNGIHTSQDDKNMSNEPSLTESFTTEQRKEIEKVVKEILKIRTEKE